MEKHSSCNHFNSSAPKTVVGKPALAAHTWSWRASIPSTEHLTQQYSWLAQHTRFGQENHDYTDQVCLSRTTDVKDRW